MGLFRASRPKPSRPAPTLGEGRRKGAEEHLREAEAELRRETVRSDREERFYERVGDSLFRAFVIFLAVKVGAFVYRWVASGAKEEQREL